MFDARIGSSETNRHAGHLQALSQGPTGFRCCEFVLAHVEVALPSSSFWRLVIPGQYHLI